MFDIMKAFRLDGKLAIITGGSGLFGRQMLLALAQAGARVCNASRNLEHNEACAAELRAQGYDVFCEPLDQGDPESIAAFVRRIREKHGRIDVLVNNAVWRGMKNDEDWEGFATSLRINAIGMSDLSMKCAKIMREHGGGSIINVASINGVSPGAFQGVYSMTKAAVINMTKVFAKECAPLGIRCNALLPGLTDTKFASALVKNDAILKGVLQQIPLNRVANPEEMAGAVLYLASDASTYTTGVSLNVDGGFLS